jgi:acyl phosphate:glycerol-3-phosphate acyltransferase
MAVTLLPIWILLSYLSGAVPYGVLLSRARGVDLRQVGSGNIGATNASRALGKKLGLAVLLLDILKGLLPVLAARLLLPPGPHKDNVVACAMVAAVLGHLFPVFLKFRGGKGVATGLGVYLAAAPLVGLIGALVYAGLYAAFRISSLGSLVATLAVPGFMFLLKTPLPQCLAGSVIAAFIILKHHQNIRRLLRGEEKKI